MKKIINNKGFTLAELLVSSAIFLTVSSMIVTILFIAFRVSQRTEITLAVKSNGNSALSQMSDLIKYAQSIDTPASCISAANRQPRQSITFTSAFDNGQTTLSCQTGAASTIASNGAAMINTSAVTVQSCSFTCNQTTVNDPPTITIQFSLTSKNYVGTTETNTLLPFQTAVTMRNFVR